MKVALIWPNASNPWPPTGWGAIEKYVWEYKNNLIELGFDAHLRYSNSGDLGSFDIIQSHTWNQSLILYERGLSYIFSFDDTHVIYFGNNSTLYKNNVDAIKKSDLTIVHSEYLVDYFNYDNIFYLRHGSNPNKFKFLNSIKYEHSLLCVGKTDQNDRKGFGIAIDSASKIGLPITVVGPNDDFFDKNNFNYNKLTILGNKNDDELLNIYNEHTIFLHPSKLETGHPNLTLIESIYCGTPVIGTCDVNIDGMLNMDLNSDDITNNIKYVIDNYNYYQNGCFKLKNSGYYDWYNITKDLVNLYYKYIKIKKNR